MRTLFLQAPSFDGFDGGAGSRYQAKREIRSFWYPTWLAQPAALVPNSKLIDAPPHGSKLADVAPPARDFDLVVAAHLGPLFRLRRQGDRGAEGGQPSPEGGPDRRQGRRRSGGQLAAPRRVDFVARNEFDFTIKEVAEGGAWTVIPGLSYRNADGAIVHNEARPILENMDALPFVTPVYKRDLKIENYFIGYLKHPYSRSTPGAAANRAAPSACGRRPWAGIAIARAASAMSSRRSPGRRRPSRR